MYRITTWITGQIPNGCHIVGESIGGSIDSACKRGSVIKNSAGGTIFRFSNSGQSGAWEISNLGFVSSGAGIHATDAYFGYIHDCSFFNVTDAIIVTGSNFGLRITNNSIYGGSNGIKASSSEGLIIANNYIGATSAVAIDMDYLSGCTHVVIVGNNFSSLGTYGVKARNCSGLVVGDNVFFSGSGPTVAVRIEQSGAVKTNAVVSNNMIDLIGGNAGDIGVDVSGCENTAIRGNVINATKALNLATNGGHTCGGTYYDGNICVAFVGGTYGQIVVGGGVTATPGTNITGV